MFHRHKNFLVPAGFLVPDEMTVCDNAAMHAKGCNSHLNQAMKLIGTNVVTSPKHSPELNPIELMFNVMVRRLNLEFN